MTSASKPDNETISNMLDKIVHQLDPKDPRLQTAKKYNEAQYIDGIIKFVSSGSKYWSKFKSPIDIHRKHKYYLPEELLIVLL